MQVPFEEILDECIRNAVDGTATLFVGAGLSFLLKNKMLPDGKVPNGLALTEDFHDALSIAFPRHTLERISGQFLKKNGTEATLAFLEERFKIVEVDAKLEALYRLNWRRIYTTNYDDAISLSRKDLASPVPLTLADPPASVPFGAQIHINGSISKVTPYNLNERLLLTDASYATQSFVSSPWAQFFRTDLQLSKSILFVGYSLFDLDIARILLEDSGLRRKTLFVVGAASDQVEKDALEPYGRVSTDGFDLVARRQETVSKTHVKSKVSLIFSALSNISEIAPSNRASAAILSDQLIFGHPPFGEILSNKDVFGSQKFLIERTKIAELTKTISNGGVRDVTVTGELASGKTFAAIQLAKYFMEVGYEVLWVRDGRNLRQELDYIALTPKKLCVVIDGYRKYLPAIRSYLTQRHALHSLVLTERATVHELIIDSLNNYFDENKRAEIFIETLDRTEIAGFDALINYSGRWDKLSGSTAKSRVRYVQDRLDSSLYRILLDILNSEQVRMELNALLAPIKADPIASQFLSTALIVNTLGYHFNINDWQIFYDISNIRHIIRSYEEYTRHFIYDRAATIEIRSGLLSTFLIRELADDSMVASCLIDMFQFATNNIFDDAEFSRILVDPMKHSTVEPLFSASNKLTALTAYYEGIRPIGATRDNPDYWLQYGIAMTVHDDLEEAGVAFSNAYSRERAKSKPNLTRIDNFYARYEMKKSYASSDASEAFKFFDAGFKRLLGQIFRQDNRHYPFKVGREITEIASKHYSAWTRSQQTTFLDACKALRDKAVIFNKKSLDRKSDVEALIRDAETLIARLGA